MAATKLALEMTERAVSGATTAAAQEFVIADAASAAYTVTGPTPGAGVKRWGVKREDSSVGSTSSFAITVSFLNSAGVATTADLTMLGESKVFRAAGSGFRVESGDTPHSQVAVRYQAVLNPKRYGAKCDGVLVYDGAVTGGSTTLTSASLRPFSGSKTVLIDGAGTSGVTLQTTMTCTVSGTGTLAAAAVTTVANAMTVWGTDDSAAWVATLAAWYAQGGGTIKTPGISIASGLTIPNDGSADVDNQKVPRQPPLRLTGDGAWSNGEWANKVGALSPNGSVLVLYGATGPAKIDTRGSGVFEFEHLTALSIANDAVPILQTTNTDFQPHHYCFAGRASKSGTACTQDAIVLGGQGYQATAAAMTSGQSTLTIGGGDPPFTAGMVGYSVVVKGAGPAGAELGATITAYTSATQVTLSATASTTVSGAVASTFNIGADANAPFQGYNTRFGEGGYFTNIRRTVLAGFYCNGIEIGHYTISKNCGSNLAGGAAVELVGSSASGVNCGNTIGPILCEQSNYPYLTKSQNAQLNQYVGCHAFDQSGTSLAVHRFESGGRNNLVIEGYRSGALPSKSEDVSGSNVGTNTVIGGLDQATVFALSIGVASNLRALASSSANGAFVFNRNGTDTFQWYQNSTQSNLFLRDLVNAKNVLDINPGAAIINANYLLNLAAGMQRGYKAKTANYTVLSTDDIVVYNGTSLVATLPNAGAVSAGRIITIKNINASALTVNSFSGSQFIDGATSQAVAQWGTLRLVSDGGVNWYSI